MGRKIAKVWSVVSDGNIVLFSLCEDNTLWVLLPGKDSKWLQFPPIPEHEVQTMEIQHVI